VQDGPAAESGRDADLLESLPGIFERELRRMRQLERENRQLTQIVAMNSR
jgi:hypothetical protein